jgi:DNA-binding transcriptional MerR regulator
MVGSTESLLTTAQVAKALGVSSRTIVRYAGRGWITPVQTLPSGHRRWLLSQVRGQLRQLEADRAGESN